MELGPCASSSFEPCQARKGAALRGTRRVLQVAWAPWRARFLPCPSPCPFPMRDSASPDHRPEPLQHDLCRLLRPIRFIGFPARNLEEFARCSEPGSIS